MYNIYTHEKKQKKDRERELKKSLEKSFDEKRKS
jgi:hypothetical protein